MSSLLRPGRYCESGRIFLESGVSGSKIDHELRLTLLGYLVIHCHIDWHLAHGFAAAVVVQPNVIRKFKIPAASKEVSTSYI